MKPTSSPVSGVASDRSWHLQQLQTLHDRLLHSAAVQTVALRQTGECHPADLGDSASDDSCQDNILSILSSEEDALHELEAAMHRIAEGRYGICEETGLAIPEERLRALPWTRYTREAAERLELKSAEILPTRAKPAENERRCVCPCSGSGACRKQLPATT